MFHRLFAETAGSNPAGRMDLSLFDFARGQLEVYASSLSLVQRSRTECGVSA